MDASRDGAVAETHLNDLQADIEAASRLLEHVHRVAEHIRERLVSRGAKDVAHMRAMMKRLAELKACVRQQRATARELRHDIRRLRDQLEDGSPRRHRFIAAPLTKPAR